MCRQPRVEFVLAGESSYAAAEACSMPSLKREILRVLSSGSTRAWRSLSARALQKRHALWFGGPTSGISEKIRYRA